MRSQWERGRLARGLSHMYREEMDDIVRWTHRITSSSGDWSGNLYDFFWRVYPRLKSDINVPFDLQDGVSRVDEPAGYMLSRI